MANTEIPKRLNTQIVKASTQAKSIEVCDDPSYYQACEYLAYVQLKRREITDHYKQIKDALNTSRRTVLDMEKTHLSRLEPAEARLTELILEYETRHSTSQELEEGEGVVALVPPDGQHNRATHQVVVDDLQALVAAVAEGRVPLDTLKAHVPALNKLRKQYGGLFRVPGCRVETRTTVVTT
jgi:uncharacterized protein with von Willebrand factor type A (vWA) domain